MLVLTIIFKIIINILLVLIGLAAALLIIPFTYSGEALVFEGYRLRLNFGWAWNSVKVKADVEEDNVDVALQIFNKRVYKLKTGKTHEKEEPEQEGPKEGKEKGKRGPGLKDLTDKEFLHEIFEYIKKVIGIARPKYLHLYGTYGFDDPALTGLACGAVGIIKTVLPEAKLNLRPVFDEEVLDLDFKVQGSMTAGSLAYQTVRTVFKKPVRKIIFKKKK